jgi:PAS domain S-box-containing protein
MITILYVDDEIELLKLCKIFLERSGDFSVDICTSAPESLKRLQSGSYDAIISDYHMPFMDGIAFLKTVRVQYGDIPFILFTGRGREEVVIEAINNGADFYLQKGGDPRSEFAELSHKIRQAVRRKEAERSLQDSEKRQSDIIEFLPDATFAIDQSGHVIAWNRAIEEMTGISSADMLGKGDYEYSIPFYGFQRPILIDMIDEPDEKVSGFYSNTFRKGNSLSAETSLTLPKGKPISVLIKVSRLFNKSGENIGAIESIRDITDVRDTERSLIRSREEYRRIIETAQEGIWEIDSSNCTTYVNDRLARMLGYKADEIIGRDLSDFILPEDLPDHQEKMETWKKGVSNSYERRFVRKDGKIIWTNLFRVPIRDGDTIVGSFGTVIDITERKRAEEELAVSEREFRALFENTEAATIIIEEDSTISRANAAYTRLIKLPGDVIQGTVNWPGSRCEEDQGAMLRQHLIQSGDTDSASQVSEFCLKDSVGTVHTVMAHFGMIPGTRKSIVSLIDITPLKDTELKLIRKSDELLASNLQLTAAEEELRRQYKTLSENEITLKQSKQQLEDIASNIPGVLFQAVVGSEGDLGVTYVSNGMDEYFGIHTDGTDIFRRFSSLVHPDDSASFLSSVQAAVRNRRDWQYEGRYRKPGRETIWFSGAASCSSQNGEMIYNGVLLDISDEKAAQLDLRASEERFRGMAERSSDLILILDQALRITYASPSARSIIGYDPEELVGRSQDYAAETFFSQSSAEFLETIRKIRDMNRIENCEIRIRKKDNTPVFVNFYAVPIIHEGVFDGIQISMRVITSERKIRKALKQSEEKFRRFVENATEIVFSLTPQGIFSYITPNIKDLLAYEISEIIGKPFSGFIHPDDYPRNLECFART